MSEIRILVLMSTHNRPKNLRDCLESLLPEARNFSLSVSLANSGDKVCLPPELEKIVRIHSAPSNYFWAEAMYYSAEKEYLANSFDYVVWLNEDVVLVPDALGRLVEIIQATESDIVIGQTYSRSGQITYGGYSRKSRLRSLHFDRLIAEEAHLPAHTFNGNIVLLGPKALQQIGPFLHGYKHYLADMAYGLEAKRRGLTTNVAAGISGYCEPNSGSNPALDPNLKRLLRLSLLNKPQGLPILQQWKFSIRYGGAQGLIYFLATYIRFFVTLFLYKDKP